MLIEPMSLLSLPFWWLCLFSFSSRLSEFHWILLSLNSKLKNVLTKNTNYNKLSFYSKILEKILLT